MHQLRLETSVRLGRLFLQDGALGNLRQLLDEVQAAPPVTTTGNFAGRCGLMRDLYAIEIELHTAAGDRRKLRKLYCGHSPFKAERGPCRPVQAAVDQGVAGQGGTAAGQAASEDTIREFEAAMKNMDPLASSMISDFMVRSICAAVDPGEAFVVALVCRSFRDELCTRFPARTPRFRTSVAAVVASPARLEWVRGLRDRPLWVSRWGAGSADLPQAAVFMARCGRLETLRWARAHGCRWNGSAIVAAAGAGNLELVRWLCANGCTPGTTACAAAAKGGYLDVLKLLRADGSRSAQLPAAWDWDTASCAAGAGHLDLLKWSRENGCDWNASAYSSAAGGGHVEVLQYLHEIPAFDGGCNWEESTCNSAARGGHLAVIQWARANGCDWYQAICLRVAPGGSKTREWIIAQPG